MLLSILLVSAISETASATLREANLDAINSESGQPCESDHDCSLNGRCQDRRCQCDIPWSGVDCGVLQTRPAQRGGLYGYQQRGYWPNGTAKTSSWGGNILPSATGDGWEAFVAEIPRGLANWQHESRCIYATSPQRSGPFVKAGVALPAECHNPQVLRERETGDYLLFHLGASDPETGQSRWLSRSKSPGGPFLPANTSAVHACNNPAPAYHPNGSLYVICNHNQITHIPPGDEALRRGAWAPLRLSLNPHAPGAAGCGDPARSWEDPHLWFDSRGNWHIVYHVYCMLPYDAHHECFSGHAFSTNGIDWTFSKTEPFGGTVTYVDGGNTTFSTRERPKFVYSDETMTRPVAVITGVSQSFGYVDGQVCSKASKACCATCNRTVTGHYEPPTCSQCKHPPTDYTYTQLEPLYGF